MADQPAHDPLANEPAAQPEQRHDLRSVLTLGVLVFGSWAAVLRLRPWVRAIPDLLPPDMPVHAGVVTEHATLLYAIFPLWLVAVLIVLLAPGLIAALHVGAARTVSDTVIRAFGLAYALRFFIHVLGIGAGLVWSTGLFIVGDVLLLLALWIALLVRVLRGHRVEGPWAQPGERRRLGWLLGLPLVLGLVLLPWIFWQDLNGDAIEVFEIGRSVATHIIPRSWDHVRFQPLGIGTLTAAYPVHWFVSLLGPVDASARLPILLFSPLMFAVVVELAEARSPRRMVAAEEFALLAAMVSFTLAIGLSGSEEPYSADLAMPAATDGILVVCVAAALLFLWRRQTLWFLWFALLACFGRPTGLLFLLLLAPVLVLMPGPDRWGSVWRTVLAIGLFLGAAWLFEAVYIPSVTGARGTSVSVLNRMQYLRFTDVQRFLFLIVPTGVVPAAALFALRRQDALARVVAVVCVGYFAFFYVEAFIALHHFVLAMFFPAVVWWRVALHSGHARRFAILATAGAGLGIALALPPDFELYRMPRAIGSRMVYRVGDYLGTEDEYRESLGGISALHLLFAAQREESLSEFLVVNALVVTHYSTRLQPPLATANYVVQPATMAAPAGFTQVGTADGASAFVRDTTMWLQDRTRVPPTDFQSRVYAIPQRTLKRYIGVPEHNYDLNLGELPFFWRLLTPGDR